MASTSQPSTTQPVCRRAPFPARRPNRPPPPARRSRTPPGRRCRVPRRPARRPLVRHGIANTSAIAWWAGSSSPGTPSVKTTCSATPTLCARRCSVDRYGPPPTITSAAPGDALPDRGQCPDQHVLALARHQPRHAYDHRTVAKAVARAQFGPRDVVGHEPVDVDPGWQMLEGGVGAECRCESAAGVAADVGHHVGTGSDAAQRRSRQREHRPADLVAVRARDDSLRAGVAGQRSHQCQRRGRAEPDGVDVVALDQLAHPPARPSARAASAWSDGAPPRNRRRGRTPRRPSIWARTPTACAGRIRPGWSPVREGRTGCRRVAAESHW